MALLTSTDLKYTLRQLAKKPGFALLSTLVLAGGLGISIIMATLSYTLMFKTIPMENGDRIRHVCYSDFSLGCRVFDPFEFSLLRAEVTTLENIGVYQQRSVSFQIGDEYLQGNGLFTEWNIFQLSNNEAQLGRTLLEFDHEADAEPVAVISHDLWQRHFSGDIGVVNRLISLQGRSTRIVGVMPEGFAFPFSSDIWLPISQQIIAPLAHGGGSVQTFAMLKEGVSNNEASEEVSQLMSRIRELYPPDADRNYASEYMRRLSFSNTAHVKTLPLASLGGLETVILIGFLNFISLCIFLLATINVGTLLIARTNERIKDISIRVALGAPRVRLLSQTMSEGLLISLTGGILALLFAGAFLELINVMMDSFDAVANGEAFGFWQTFSIDRITLISVGLFLLLSIYFTSVVPCLRIINGDFNSIMRDGTRGALGLRAGKMSRALVLTSITLIVFLFYISALTLTQVLPLRNMLATAPVDGQLNTGVSLTSDRYDATSRERFYNTLLESLQQQSTIRSVLIDSYLGFGGVLERLDNTGNGESGLRAPAYGVLESEGMVPGGRSGITLLEGRQLGVSDTPNSPKVMLVNKSVADRLWPNDSAVGKSVRYIHPITAEEGIWQIVGVTSDGFDAGNPFADSTPLFVFPINQTDAQRIGIHVGVADLGGFESLDSASNELARTILSIDPALNFSIENYELVMTTIIRAISFGIYIGVGCLIFALGIALTGIYGLTQNSVQLMTQEIGTRRALGASDGLVKKWLIKRGSKQLVYGFLIAMLLTSPLTYAVLFFVENDVLAPVYLQVCVAMTTLICVVFAAIYFPVNRVLRMEPAESLRYE